MRSIAWILILPLFAISCGSGGRGRLRIEGAFANINQADFLLVSPDGGLEDVDTLHLLKGEFSKDISLEGGPYQFIIVYPNYVTLTFFASEGQTVRIDGDALALADVKVKGADSVVTEVKVQHVQKPLKVGERLPKVDSVEVARQDGRYMLIGFWANWRGGSSVVNTHIRRMLNEHPESLCALSYSLDLDNVMRRVHEARGNEHWTTFCDFLGWDSPAVREFGINNLPYYILIDPKARVVAFGSNFQMDIESSLKDI